MKIQSNMTYSFRLKMKESRSEKCLLLFFENLCVWWMKKKVKFLFVLFSFLQSNRFSLFSFNKSFIVFLLIFHHFSNVLENLFTFSGWTFSRLSFVVNRRFRRRCSDMFFRQVKTFDTRLRFAAEFCRCCERNRRRLSEMNRMNRIFAFLGALRIRITGSRPVGRRRRRRRWRWTAFRTSFFLFRRRFAFFEKFF